jgi:putative spermidine/putrescine transport system ATP-binding protein
MNRVPAQATGSGEVEVLGARLPQAGDPRPRGPVQALLRPEDLIAVPDLSGTAIVTAKSFRGAATRATVPLSAEELLWVDLPSPTAADIGLGDPVTVSVTATAVLVD